MTSSILKHETPTAMKITRAGQSTGTARPCGCTVVALLFCGLLTTGCGMARPRTVSQTSPTSEPMVTDEAMLHRDWSPSVAHYATGTVQAYPRRWPYEGAETDIPPLNAFVDPVIFLAQTVMLPVRLAIDPPAHRFVNYGGPTVDPSYNAMP